MKPSHWLLLAAAGVSGALLLPYFGAVSTRALPAQEQPIQATSDGAHGTARGSDLVEPLKRESLAVAPVSDPFAPRSWKSPSTSVKVAPARPRAAAPAAPLAPAFPYRYAGRVDVGSAMKEAYLLRANGELVPFIPGAVVDGVWRIDRLTAEHVEVTYLPLRQSEALSLASLTAEAARPPSRLAEAGTAAVETQASSGIQEPGPRAERNEEPRVASRGAAGGSGGLAVPLGLPATTSLARLGDEVPTKGSMPMDTGIRGGAVPTGSFPSGPTPTGRLGETTPAGKPGPQ